MKRVTLRAKIALYLVLLHGALGGIAFFVLRERPGLLLAVEGFFAVSVTVGIVLARAFFVPLEMIRIGAELIEEREFGTRFRETGQPELDALVRIYNRMIDRLREERLRLTEQNFFLHSLLEASPAGVITLDHDGRVADVNPAAARLLRSPELGAALDGVAPGRSAVVTVDGRRRLRVVGAQFLDRGAPRRFFVVDELTEELRASERAGYQRLVRMISHEVNNSVGAVSSLLESLGGFGRDLSSEERAEFVAAVEVARGRLAALGAFTRGYADVVRLPDPDLRPCDIAALLDDLLLLMKPELERRRIVVRWAERAPRPPFPADKNQLEQVFVNVLKNAIEAIGEDGTITIAYDVEGRLSIADSGAGISPEVASRLFTPFFSSKADGRGLGLTLVAEVLGRHGRAIGTSRAAGAIRQAAGEPGGSGPGADTADEGRTDAPGLEFGLATRPEGGAEFWVRLD